MAEEKQPQTRGRTTDGASSVLHGDQLPLPYQSLDANGRILVVNRKWLERLGYEWDEVVGQWFGEFLTADSQALFRDQFERFKAVGWAKDVEFEMLRSDGIVVRTCFNGAAETDPDGRFQQTHCLVRDVTKQRAAEDALRESEALLGAVLDSSPDLILMLDSSLHIRFANRTVPGIALDDLMGAYLPDLASESDRTEAIRVLHRTLEQGVPGAYETKFTTPDGDVRYYESLAESIPDASSGEPEGAVVISRDVTHRKQAELAVAEERDRAQQYLDIAAVMIVAIDLSGTVVLMNQMGGQILGCAPEEALGLNWFESFIPERVRDDVRAVFAELMSGKVGLVEHFENVICRRDGTERIIEWNNTLLMDQDGRIAGTLSSGDDVTERKEAERALARSLQEWETTFAASNDAIWLLDAEHRIVRCNRATKEVFGVRCEEILGDRCWNVVHRAAEPVPECPAVRARDSLKRESMELPVAGRWLRITADPILDEEGVYTGAVHNARDVTEAKRADIALRESSDRLRILRTQLDQATEEERRRIARELHDQVSQNLTALSITAGSMDEALSELAPDLRHHVRECQLLIEETAEHIRDLTFDLRPPVLDDFGLLAAIGWHCDRVAGKSALDVRISGEEPEPRLPHNEEMALFRIVQEALTNVLKHALAKTVWIDAVSNDDGFELTLRDNGRGMDASEGFGGGWGLLNMRERAEALGGTFEIETSPGAGTMLRVRMPR